MMMFLLAVTLTSMLLAAIMSVVAWRIAREERRRSDARVAALAADIHDRPHTDMPAERRVAPVALDELELRPATGGEPTGRDLFAAAQTRTRSRWPALVSGGALVLAGAVALIVVSSGASNIGARAAAPPAQVAAARPQPAPERPLELVALAHERNGDRLTVRGIVRNPDAGTPVEHLTAVVFLFTTEGGFLASGRATIDPSTLRPGAESPFVVTVPGAGDVGRYRVSFRTDDRVVPHIDRRQTAQSRL